MDQEVIASKKLQEKGVEPKAVHVCHLCNVTCQSPIVFDSHLRGQKHAAMLSQSEVSFITICFFFCVLKESTSIEKIYNLVIMSGTIYRYQALIDSKKLQEKGVGEKDQLIEAIGESQLHSQMAQESIKCLEKHVAMVNQSEASFLTFIYIYI